MLQRTKDSGFSLIEAMIASLIMAITFAGVYTLTAYSGTSMKNSVDRQKMQLVANQMLEVITSDFTNVDNYNLNLTSCAAPAPEETQSYHQYRYKWCRMLNESVGTAAVGDVRSITVTNSGTGKIIHIILESRNRGSQVVTKNFYE